MHVEDNADHVMQGLAPLNFTVLDNGEAQTINYFREVGSPAVLPHVLIVLDEVNNGPGFLKRLKKDLDQFLSSDRADLSYPLAFIVFGVSGTAKGEFSRDREALRGMLDRVTKNVQFSDCEVESSGLFGSGASNGSVRRSALTDCVFSHSIESINALRAIAAEEENTAGPAVVVWPGAGWPLLTDFGMGPGPEGVTANYHEALVELVTNLRRNQVDLEAFSYGAFDKPRDYRRPELIGIRSGSLTADQAAELKLALPDLARLAGGAAVEKKQSLVPLLADCFREFDHYYYLAFQVAPSRAQDEGHTIAVRVDKPGAKVRSLSLYFAQP